MARLITGIFALMVGVGFGLVARHGWKTGEANSNWPYPPIRRETHPFLFPLTQLVYAFAAFLLVITGFAAIFGLTPTD